MKNLKNTIWLLLCIFSLASCNDRITKEDDYAIMNRHKSPFVYISSTSNGLSNEYQATLKDANGKYFKVYNDVAVSLFWQHKVGDIIP